YGGALRWHAFGGLSNGRIVGIGRAHQGSRAPVPFVQPIDFSSGELLPRPPVPLVAQGVDGWSELRGTQWIGAAHVVAPTGPEVCIRSVDTQDGETRWATIDPILSGTPGHN